MLTFTLIMSGFLKQKGSYRKLRVCKVTEIIYDLTFYFCEHYLKLGDRTVDHPRFERMRRFVTGEEFEKTYSGLMRRLSDEELANMAITLINQANYMLNRLIERQQELFLANGGVREQMTRARRQARATRSVKSYQSDNSDKSERSDKSE